MKMAGALIFLLLAVPGRAQTPSQKPGEPVAPQKLPIPPKAVREQDAPLALALNLAFGATVWAQIQISTAGPVSDLDSLVQEGFYKRELIELIVISVDGRRPLKDVVAFRRKGRLMDEVAREFGLSADLEEKTALQIEGAVDRDYLPRFPEHKLHHHAEED